MQHLYLPLKRNFKKSLLVSILTLCLFATATLQATPLAGNYTVGSGQTYATITAAIADLTTNGVSAAVTFTLTDATYSTAETFPISIGAFANASSTNTVTICPSAGNSGVSITSANTTATFIYNGTSFFSIDGRPGATGSTSVLSITNTSTTGVAIKITNDASNNLVTYCNVCGQNTTSVPSITTAAGVIFINSANATSLAGNDKNTISYCNIHGTGTTTSTFPSIGICAFGTQTTTGSYNDSCTISNCNIYDVFNATLAATHIKIDLGNTAWNILNNHFYQTTSINYATSAAVYRALWVTPNVSNIANAANGFVINGNFIGGSTAAGTGTLTMTGTSTYAFWAMDISVGLGTPTSLQNNTITNIDITTANTGSTALEGINIANGNANVGTVTGNIFGSSSSTPGITFTASANTSGLIGFRTGGGTNNVINISNNIIAGIVLNSATSVAAIFNGIAASGGTTVNITNNIIGSATVANSINAASASTSASIQSMRAIIANGTGTSGTISGNLISNMNSNSVATGTQGSSMVGITVASTAGAYSITGNTIRNLSSSGQTSAGGSTSPIVAIVYASTTGPAIISGNSIHSMKLTHGITTAVTNIIGIYYAGPTGNSNTIEKNFIHSLSITSSDTALAYVRAISLASGNATVQNNFIRLGYDETGAEVGKTILMAGINEDGGINSIYYNSIYLGGTVSVGSSNSYAFITALGSVGRGIINNNFVNTRSNTAGIGKHYAIKLNGSSGQAINANNYWTGTNFLAQNNSNNITSLSLWQAATAQDSISVSASPNFKNATGSSTTLDMHIDTAGTAVSYLESSGLTIASTAKDFDNDTRPGPTGSVKGGGTRPDIGADEFDGVPRTPCSNSTAGNAISSLDTICAGGSATLNLSSSTGLGVGNSYQWQSSANGVNYSNITGANQIPYTTTGLTSTTYFRCVLTCYFGSTSSNSAAKKITVINPQITSTTPGSNCGAGTIVLGATTSLGKINWYANATGGTVLDTGITFTTPLLSTTTTYYTDAIYNGCASSSRTAVVATIKTIPTITAANSNSLCGPGPVMLSATTSAGTIDWYAASTGGASLATGIYFTTPSITSTTTYYVEVTANGCTSAFRTPVIATIIPLPTITSVTPAGTCSSGSIVLHATANSGTISWFAASGGGTPLDTGTTFTTPVLFAPTNYYVEAQLNSCTSATRTSVLASIYSNPNITGTTSASGCLGDKLTLGASASAGVINWYTAATGGTSIATGVSFTTPSLTTTTTYYVDATANGCTSSFRTPAKATINPIPSISAVISASSCGPKVLTLEASALSGIIYWYADSTGGTALTSGITYTTPLLTTTTKYYVEVKENNCSSYPRTAVVAKITKIPTITSTIPASSCKPAALNLSATASAGVVRWYSVPFGGSILNTGTNYTTGLISSTTTYYIEALDSGCVSASRTALDATIFPAINKSTTLNGFTISAVANGINYQWLDCDKSYSPIAGAIGQNFTPTQNGNYAVSLKNSNCTDTSACVAVTKIGIDPLAKQYEISVSPNPANAFFVLKAETRFEGNKFNLTDILGRIVLSGVIEAGNQKIVIEQLVPGIYLLNVEGKNKMSFRIMKN